MHLAVDIPDGCSITVAGQTRTWREGRCLLFDYSLRARGTQCREPAADLSADRPVAPGNDPPRTAGSEIALITEIRRLMGEQEEGSTDARPAVPARPWRWPSWSSRSTTTSSTWRSPR
ncbi:aspartyl/asparaginyl beta-hydroxylase domain-containing protein [Streptomyces sp. L7]